jgi:hypothetical protein
MKKPIITICILLFPALAFAQPPAPPYAPGTLSNVGNFDLNGYKITGGGENGIYVDSSGNVGIANSSPGFALDVNGQANFESATFPVLGFRRTSGQSSGSLDAISGVASSFALYSETTGDMGTGYGGGMVFFIKDATSSDEVAARIYARRDSSDSDGLLQFFTSSANPAVTIRDTDYVGVGTTSPDELLDVNGNIQQSPGDDTHGGYVSAIYTASVNITAAATATLDLNIPSGWVIKGCQLHVKTALAAGETWDAEINDGGTEESITTNAAVAVDTNVNHFGHADVGYGGTLTDAETDIVISPNGGGSFTAQGTIEGHCLAFGFDSWDNE